MKTSREEWTMERTENGNVKIKVKEGGSNKEEDGATERLVQRRSWSQSELLPRPPFDPLRVRLHGD